MTPSPTRIDYEKRIFRAMDYISLNIERDLSLEEIADAAAFSPFHFHRIFKAVVGENVAEFARRLRIELAANRLLAYPRQSVTEIALSSGFSSSQNFAKAFRQFHAMTPSQYRGVKAGQAATPHTGDMPRKAAKAVEIKEMPETTAATIRRIGSYTKICPAAFAELFTWARGKIAPGPGTVMAFYWDNPEVTPEDKCRFDCCILMPASFPSEGSVFLQKVGGGAWAFCRFETEPDGIRSAWEESFRWLVENGYECRPLPCAEIYLNDARLHPEGKWIIDIAIPLITE